MSEEFRNKESLFSVSFPHNRNPLPRTPESSAAGGSGRKMTPNFHSRKTHLLLILYICIMPGSLKCYSIYMVPTTKFKESREGIIINSLVQIRMSGTQRLSKLLIIT